MRKVYRPLILITAFLIGTIDSIICPPGKFNLTQGNTTVCDSCKSGSFASTRGATICELCVAGKFSTVIGANSSSTCISCPANSASGPGSSSRQNCTCNPGYTGENGSCTICPAGTYKELQGDAPCSICSYGSNSTSGAARCFCLPGFQKTNRSVTPYDPGVICSDPECPVNALYTASSGLLCRLKYNNSESVHWMVTPTAQHAGLLFTFLRFETELQHDFVTVYSCLSLACCHPATADPPDPSCLRSTPIVVSGTMRPDYDAQQSSCNTYPLLRTTTNPIEEFVAHVPRVHTRTHCVIFCRLVYTHQLVNICLHAARARKQALSHIQRACAHSYTQIWHHYIPTCELPYTLERFYSPDSIPPCSSSRNLN
jgi:hypothetical protein